VHHLEVDFLPHFLTSVAATLSHARLLLETPSAASLVAANCARFGDSVVLDLVALLASNSRVHPRLADFSVRRALASGATDSREKLHSPASTRRTASPHRRTRVR
jgi:hypothetical protein